MSTGQTTRPPAPGDLDATRPTPFDLPAFAQALESGDLGYLLSRYAAEADIRITTGTAASEARVVSGTQAIRVYLHEAAAGHPPATVSRLVDGGDRVAFTQHWRRADGTTGRSISTAELQDGLIMTQHTILVRYQDPDAGPGVG